jgi:hypothetical protein
MVYGSIRIEADNSGITIPKFISDEQSTSDEDLISDDSDVLGIEGAGRISGAACEIADGAVVAEGDINVAVRATVGVVTGKRVATGPARAVDDQIFAVGLHVGLRERRPATIG